MTVDTVIQLVAIVMGSNWLGQFLTELYKSKKKKKTPAEVILKALARVHLLSSAERYHEQGFINEEEYDDIFEEYKAYRNLDGNGRAAREYGENGELHKLPIK